MKSFTGVVVLFFLEFGLYAQIPFFGFERQAQLISLTADEQQVVGYGSNWKQIEGNRILGKNIFLWDLQGNEVRKRDITSLRQINYNGSMYRGMLTSGAMLPNKNTLCIIGTQYQHKAELIQTVFHFYDIVKDSLWFLIPEISIEVKQLVFHPQNPDLIGIIGFYSEQSVAVLYDMSVNQVKTIYRKTKHPDYSHGMLFSSDGSKVFVGYMNSSYAGGFCVFETHTGKMIKKIAMNDQPLQFYESEDRLIVAGNKASYFYETAQWTLRNTGKYFVQGVHAQSGLCVITSLSTSRPQLSLINLKTRHTEPLFINELNAVLFSSNAEYFIGIYPKNEFDNQQVSLSIPSAQLVKIKR
ncbi:MAG: hypothetical protein MH137_08420 [Flavobacteriales bacterium]|nr:hypothetical protein [Flavobacteriales bacterium]